MYKRSALAKFIVIIIILNLLFHVMNLSQLTQAKSLKKNILIIYDQRNYFGENLDTLRSVVSLISHFNVEITEMHESKYQANDCDTYDFIFVVGMDGSFSNKNLIKDLQSTDQIIIWLGKGVNQLLDSQKFDLTYRGELTDFVKIFYMNGKYNFIDKIAVDKFISLDSKREFTVLESLSPHNQIYAYLNDGSQNYPYIIRSKNLWHVSRVEAVSSLFYILADILYEILDEEPMSKNQIYIRIEDVHPFRDVNKLRQVAEYLYSENIPFMIALIPAYKNSHSGYVTTLNDKQEFTETIRYMQKLGGSVILHGYTHQAFGGELTGEGFEFWDGDNDKPIPVDTENWVNERITSGLNEAIENGIYPLAFEFPHYAASQKAYKEIKKYFSTVVGHLQTSDSGYATVTFPYEIYSTQLVNKLIPESLGYIDPQNERTIEEIKYKVERNSLVRGYTTGVFYHPYIDISYLKELVAYLKTQDIDFYDLKEHSNWVRWSNHFITSEAGDITIKYSSHHPTKSFISVINNIVILITVIFSVIFLVIFIISKRKNNKKLLEGSDERN